MSMGRFLVTLASLSWGVGTVFTPPVHAGPAANKKDGFPDAYAAWRGVKTVSGTVRVSGGDSFGHASADLQFSAARSDVGGVPVFTGKVTGQTSVETRRTMKNPKGEIVAEAAHKCTGPAPANAENPQDSVVMIEVHPTRGTYAVILGVQVDCTGGESVRLLPAMAEQLAPAVPLNAQERKGLKESASLRDVAPETQRASLDVASKVEIPLPKEFGLEQTGTVTLSSAASLVDALSADGTVTITLSLECQPLREACELEKEWQECAVNTLSTVSSQVPSALADLETEYLGHTQGNPKNEAIWHPQYFAVKQAMEGLSRRVAALPEKTVSSLAEAKNVCALLPGPSDDGKCRLAAQKVSRAVKQASSKLDQDLAQAMKAFQTELGPLASTWTSALRLTNRLQTDGVVPLRACSATSTSTTTPTPTP